MTAYIPQNTTFVDFSTIVPASWLNSVNVTNFTMVNAVHYGCDPTGATDSTLAFNNMLSALSPSSRIFIYFPPGLYIFSSQVVFNLPGTGIASISIHGAGPDVTELRWTSAAGGIRINYNSPGHSAHFVDMSITTSQVLGGYGIHLFQSSSLNDFMASNIFRCNFRGSDNLGSGGGFACWTQCYRVEGVCGTNVESVTTYGPANWGSSTAAGGYYIGNLAQTGSPGQGYSIYHNIAKCIFNSLSFGITYGSFTQGMTILQTNVQNTQTGFFCPPGSTGNLAQLQIGSSQFDDNGNDISIQSPILNTMIYANNLISHGGNSSIALFTPDAFCIVGNQIISDGTANNIGVSVGSTGTGTTNTGTITGNSFINLGTAVLLQTGSSGVNVQSNSYTGNTTNVTNNGTGNTIGGGSI